LSFWFFFFLIFRLFNFCLGSSLFSPYIFPSLYFSFPALYFSFLVLFLYFSSTPFVSSLLFVYLFLSFLFILPLLFILSLLFVSSLLVSSLCPIPPFPVLSSVSSPLLPSVLSHLFGNCRKDGTAKPTTKPAENRKIKKHYKR